MFRKIQPTSVAPFLACLMLLGLLLLPGALANAADFFSHGVIQLPQSQANPAEPWHRVLSTQAEWEAFYRERAGAAASVPPIDFSIYRVVAGGVGLQPMSTRLVVDSVANDGRNVYVGVLLASAKPGCMTLHGMGYPTLAVVILQSPMPVRVALGHATYECTGGQVARQ